MRRFLVCLASVFASELLLLLYLLLLDAVALCVAAAGVFCFCSSPRALTQTGITQVFHHALSAALYPVAPLYDAKVSQCHGLASSTPDTVNMFAS